MKPSPVAARAANGTDETLGDLRFRALIADDDWATLPTQMPPSTPSRLDSSSMQRSQRSHARHLVGTF